MTGYLNQANTAIYFFSPFSTSPSLYDDRLYLNRTEIDLNMLKNINNSSQEFVYNGGIGLSYYNNSSSQQIDVNSYGKLINNTYEWYVPNPSGTSGLSDAQLNSLNQNYYYLVFG